MLKKIKRNFSNYGTILLSSSVLGLCLIPMTIFATESSDINAEVSAYNIVDEKDIIVLSDDELIFEYDEENQQSLPYETTDNPMTTFSGAMPIMYKKDNVTTSTQWSGYRRVSDNLKTGEKGGSISSTKATTFSAEVSGKVQGINVKVSGSVKNSIGYTLNVGKNKRVYLGYRVKYNVEKGKRYVYNHAHRRWDFTNDYTVKIPSYGEYALINY